MYRVPTFWYPVLIMALGSNRDYKTTDRRARTALAKHAAIMDQLMAENPNLTREAASSLAMAQMKKSGRRNKTRRDRDQVMRDMGLTRVRGALGGIYWE